MPIRMFRHARRHVLGYLALFLVLGGVGYAAIPGGDGVIHGCYDTGADLNGAYPLYVIDTATLSACPAGRSGPMTALDWNATGPPGPQGQAGPQGLAGPQGPRAEGGTVRPSKHALQVAELAYVDAKYPLNSVQLHTVTARCPKHHPVVVDSSYTIRDDHGSPLPLVGGNGLPWPAYAEVPWFVEVVNNLLAPNANHPTEGWAVIIERRKLAPKEWSLDMWITCGLKKSKYN